MWNDQLARFQLGFHPNDIYLLRIDAVNVILIYVYKVTVGRSWKYSSTTTHHI